MDLETVWRDRLSRGERSYTRQLALMLQPAAHEAFDAHPDFDEAFRLWTQGDDYRGLDVARLWSLVLNLKRVLARCEGAVAELGVYKGECSAVLAHYAHQFGRLMYMADTFTGFDEQHLETDMNSEKEAAFKDTSLDLAKSRVGDHQDNRWVVGMFPASITPEMRADTFAFVSIDCDLYEPISEGLWFFWPRLAPGGVIFVHDYGSGHWPGATRAVDEFCATKKLSGCILPDMAGSFVIVRPPGLDV